MATESSPEVTARRFARVREVETEIGGALPLHVHPGWMERYPWLIQGTTGRGAQGTAPGDLRLFGTDGGGSGAATGAFERWRELGRALGTPGIVHGRQVHGRRVLLHDRPPPGLFLAWASDGHVTATAGTLLAITVADCVPVFLLDPERRAVGLLHAGWRGAAAGILERGLAVFRDRLGVSPGDLRCHLGPAICGECYEVGPEVHDALGLRTPPGPRPLDLRRILGRRAVAAGVREDRVSASRWCTLCGNSPFFSHRGGDAERQVAVAAVRRPGATG